MRTRTKITLGEPHPHMGALISSYQDGLTDPHETETVERHLLECERCRAFYAGLQQTRELITELPDPNPDLLQINTLYYGGIMNRTTAGQKATEPPSERGLKKLITKSKKPEQPPKLEAEEAKPEKVKKAEKAKSRR
jgi:hypothetical protein